MHLALSGLLTLLLAMVSQTTGANSWTQQSDERPTTEQEITALIATLGADEYASRERAAHCLLKMGGAAEPQLRAASNHASLEVRQRAERLLYMLTLNGDEFREQIKAFAADVDGKENVTLPGWPEFRRVVGSSSDCRTLFVQMQLAESDILRAYQRDPSEAAELVEVRCSAENVTQVASIAVILFVTGSDQVEMSKSTNTRVTRILSVVEFNRAYKDGDYKMPIGKITGRWINRVAVSMANSPTDVEAYTNLLSMAQGLELKEIVPFAVKLLHRKLSDDPFNGSYVKGFALHTIGKLGDCSHIKLLAPSFDDTGQIKNPFTGQATGVQLRDVALAVSVHLSGQRMGDYGFEEIDQMLAAILWKHKPLFSNQEQRERAFAKWQVWSEENLKPAG